MAKAVYHKLWAMTAQRELRWTYGWLKVYRNLAPWGIFWVPTALWFSFPALDDDKQNFLSMGFYKRNLYYWDTTKSGGDGGWYP